ncbi:MAG: hypothetical protein WCN21_04905 [Comamonadaceae bacterium]
MPVRFPVRRFVQSTDNIQTPANRVGALEWVLARPLYRFHLIDLALVPAKNRAQALNLELAQWTPFANSAYYIGWHGQQAMVWAWDADKAAQALQANNLKPERVRVLPETVLRPASQSGLALVRCLEGVEAQVWRDGQLINSRWWPQAPGADEWLMFQRDSGIAPGEQQTEIPPVQAGTLGTKPWVASHQSGENQALQMERVAIAVGAFLLLVPTLWFGAGIIKLQSGLSAVNAQRQQLQSQATPIAQARSQALDDQARISALRALSPYPEQLALMAKVAQVLPQDKSFVKDWDFQGNQLKFTLSAPGDISSTYLIGQLQQAGVFKDVKALAGRDPKAVTFQMEVQGD